MGNGRCRKHGGKLKGWYGPRPQWKKARAAFHARWLERKALGLPYLAGRPKRYRADERAGAIVAARRLAEMVPLKDVGELVTLGDQLRQGAAVAARRFLEVLEAPIEFDPAAGKFRDVKSARLVIDAGSVMLKLYADLAKADLQAKGEAELVAFLERLNELERTSDRSKIPNRQDALIADVAASD